MKNKNKPGREELCEELSANFSYLKRVLAVKGATPDMQEEIAQQTIFEAYKNINHIRRPEKLKSWLATVAKRLYIRECNRNKKLFMYEQDEKGADETIGRLITCEEDVLEEIIRHEDSQHLAKLVMKLDSKDSSIIILRYVDDMSLKDIAIAMDMNYSTVRSIHNRALAKLKTLIETEKGGSENGQPR